VRGIGCPEGERATQPSTDQEAPEENDTPVVTTTSKRLDGHRGGWFVATVMQNEELVWYATTSWHGAGGERHPRGRTSVALSPAACRYQDEQRDARLVADDGGHQCYQRVERNADTPAGCLETTPGNIARRPFQPWRFEWDDAGEQGK